MNTKKLMACALTAASLLGLAGCGSKSTNTSKKTITLWATGSDNMRQGYQALQDGFNKSSYGDKYQLKVEFIMSGTGGQSLQDRLAAAKKAGKKNANFDFLDLNASEYEASTNKGGKDIFSKLDFSKIKNYKNLKASLSGEEKNQLMPYRGTTVVLAYDSDKVKNPPKTADELYQWIQNNPGQFAYNSPSTGGAGQSFVTTAIYNQMPEEALMSSDTKWEAQWTKGFDLLKKLHSSMYKSGGSVVYPNKNQGTLDLLTNKEVSMIPTWADMYLSAKEMGTMPSSIKITQIDPGFTGTLASLAMPSIGSKSDGCYAVMDYMLSKEAQNTLLSKMAAIPVIDTKDLDQDKVKLIKDLDVSKFRNSNIGALSDDLNKKWDNEIATLK